MADVKVTPAMLKVREARRRRKAEKAAEAAAKKSAPPRLASSKKTNEMNQGTGIVGGLLGNAIYESRNRKSKRDKAIKDAGG